MHKHKETNIMLSSDLIIDKSKSRPSTCMREAIEHIQDVEACFVFNKGHLYPILYQDEVCGCLWEYIPEKPINNGIWAGSEDAVHFGIFTYPNIQGKKLHVVQKYLEFRSGHDLYLHTMKKCKIADFYQSRYGFSFHAQDNNHIVLKKTKEKTQMRIIITAGSTREPIDEVRCITNSSTGSLGVKIAQEFLRQKPDSEIFFVHGKGSRTPDSQDERVHLIPVTSTSDLVSSLLKIPEPDIVIHSMAVSDYTVDKIFDYNTKLDIPKGGKISSNLENPCILLKPTPKVIGHIKKMWPRAFLVGFKLLDRVSQDELFDTAFKLLRKNRCNLVLANDISEIRAGNHNGMLVFPEKTKTIFSGKQNIAENLVKTTLIRQAVHHHSSILTTPDIEQTENILKEKVAPSPFFDS